MRYYVRIYTYVGSCLNASRFWAEVRTEANDRVYDSVSKRYQSREEALGDALHWFERERKRGELLIKGSPAVCDPQVVLRGPAAFKKRPTPCGSKPKPVAGGTANERCVPSATDGTNSR